MYLIDRGVPIEEIAERFSGDHCVDNFGMKQSSRCNEEADCNNCWIECLNKELDIANKESEE